MLTVSDRGGLQSQLDSAASGISVGSRWFRYDRAVMLASAADDDGLTLGDFEVARELAEIIELTAIFIIAIGVVASVVAGAMWWLRGDAERGFEKFKRVIARGLLVGLDLLIAADVIRTVTLEGTLESAAVLGLLVLIRTFLSWTLVLEVEGCWPWQRDRRQATTA